MSSKLMSLLRLGRCAHEFSWPRRWPDGEFYQVCLLCGEEYRYDWKAMCRAERVAKRSPESRRAPRHGGKAATTRWVPRARRIKLQEHEVRYRVGGEGDWHRGMVENISSTGVLFRAAEILPENTDLEMVLEMPCEICGQKDARVMCRGMVVRSVAPEIKGQEPRVAAGIWDYKFLHEPRGKQ